MDEEYDMEMEWDDNPEEEG